MRILIIDAFYPSVLQGFYRDHPDRAAAVYGEQWRALMDTFFGTADSYSHNLAHLGHEAREVVANAVPLQEAWLREQPAAIRVGVGRRRLLGWQDQVVLAQFASFEPDVVLVHNLSLLRGRTLRAMRGRALLVGQIASELPSRRRVRAFDLIVTSFPHYVPRIRDMGTQSAFLRLAFDPRVTERLGSTDRDLPISFVGSLALDQHSRGNAVLGRVAGRLPIGIWGGGIDAWPSDSAVTRAYRGEVWGIDMYRVLASSKIALNRHIDVAENHANNMRLFEATGVGSLLLTDSKIDLGELFEIGREVVAYRDEEDLVELATAYLRNDDARREIAAAGQARTLRDHTWANRMRELTAILEEHV
jgi:hypothetical protein